LDILQRKIIIKENVEEIKDSKHQEREEKQNKRIIDEGITLDRTQQKSKDKHAKVEFIESKSTIVLVRHRRPRRRRS